MAGAVARLTARARATGMRKGVLGTSRMWLAIWAVLTSARLMRRWVGHKPEVVFRQRLQPGDAIMISHEGTIEATPAPFTPAP
jgi:hypothetical protein